MALALKSKSQGKTQGVEKPALQRKAATGGLLQRKCACGGRAAGGSCEECGAKRQFSLQTKLEVGEPGDIYEREADRVAEQVTASERSVISSAPPRIQRLSGQSTGRMDSAPASVDLALAGPGKSLDQALRHDMEQRFGHDFSGVRVHVGDRASESAAAVGASAYTVGQQIVFGRGRFDPLSGAGRKLIAHELAHTIQQRGFGAESGGKTPAPERGADHAPSQAR